jgi:hypothetical protein
MPLLLQVHPLTVALEALLVQVLLELVVVEQEAPLLVQ